LLQFKPTLRRPAGEELFERSTAMDRRTIPYDEQLARDLPQEMPQEADPTSGLLKERSCSIIKSLPSMVMAALITDR
jgi:hypothetical protein